MWLSQFPQLSVEDDAKIKRIMGKARTLVFPANKLVSSPGTCCEYYILVLKGSIRVQIITDSGREVVLYHVRPGNGCILTTTCLLSGDRFPAEGITDTETEVIALTPTEFQQALQFRSFVFSNVGQRLADVITRIEQLCSPAIDRHLAKILLTLSMPESGPISVTHQELASELGTAREVVSRHLKQFELHEWVQLGRGTIRIKNRETLLSLSRK